MKVYISGPMTGIEQFNFPAFNDAAARWRAAGHEVFNPAEKQEEGTGLSWQAYMKLDIKLLCDCEAIAMLPGWEKSRGASLEVYLATQLGMNVFDALKPVIG